MVKAAFIATVFILILTVSNVLSQIPVFPGAEGFGTTTSAGRGGEIITVTNLNGSGNGSLRAAIESSGPRTIVFEVGGVIDINDYLFIRNPYITIAGQTAPSPGITIVGAGIWIQTHDVLIQHIKVRSGGRPNGPDPYTRSSLRIYQKGKETHNIVADHCTFSWATDENVTTWAYGDDNCHDITISNCIISECLNKSVHPEGGHSKGMIIGDFSINISVHRNLFAHNGDRNPLGKGRSRSVILNNLVYNPGCCAIWVTTQTMYGGTRTTKASIIGNVFKPGRNTSTGSFIVLHSWTTAYAEDNLVLEGSAVPWEPQKLDGGPVATPQEAIWHDPVTILPSENVYDCVLNNAGARPRDRDEIDERIVNEVRTGTGSMIDNHTDVGGFPDHPQTTHSLNIPSNAHGDDDGDGYTNLEEWLHILADELENSGSCGTSVSVIKSKTVTQLPSVNLAKNNSFDLYRADGTCLVNKYGNEIPALIGAGKFTPGIYYLKFSGTKDRVQQLIIQ